MHRQLLSLRLKQIYKQTTAIMWPGRFVQYVWEAFRATEHKKIARDVFIIWKYSCAVIIMHYSAIEC